MIKTAKKIIYVVTGSEWGGAQEYIYNLASNLPLDQFQVLVLAGDGDEILFQKLQSKNINFRKLKYLKRTVNPWYDKLALFELIRVYKQEKPDIIHLNSSKAGFLGSLAGKLAFQAGRKPFTVYTAHGWVFNEPLNPIIKKFYLWIEKISAGWKDVIITLSDQDKETAEKNNFHSKIVKIHNAVNPDELFFLPKKQAKKFILSKLTTAFAKQDFRLIGTIANLYKTKGIKYLVDAAAVLINKYPNFVFIVIGQGPEKENLESKIKNLKLKNNFFLFGSVADAHQYLKAFDLFVLPSVKEGMPYSLLKALVAEIQILATKVGVMPEILNKNNLIEAANSKLLAQGIEGLIHKPTVLRQHKNDFDNFLRQTLNFYQLF